ncbi:MAG TPA: ABC transporter ATP-binding protein [Chloroflexota bacterium]|nr:ABC transporter ATP-binding protein [Chloroflexota bacterium]
MAHLELQNLVKRYGATYAVQNVSLDVHDSEMVCLLGPSGCGKTTTLRIIGGFITPDEGDVRIDGRSVVKDPPERRPTGMVFQRYTLWPHMDIYHNVAFGLELRRKSRAEIDKAVRGALELVGLPGVEKRHPAQLSGGQQQRVALARALVLEPRILLLDEPLSNLDAQLRVRMREEITAIQRRVGITSVFVTHDQEEALSIADRIAVMSNGVLVQLATPSVLYAEPATLFVATFIGTMNLIEGTATDDGQAAAGPFRLPLPAGARLTPDSQLTLALRPEDLLVAPASQEGVPARITQAVDLGHYHRLSVMAEGANLTIFAPKTQEITLGSCRLQPRRALIYQGETLVGVSDKLPVASIASPQ